MFAALNACSGGADVTGKFRHDRARDKGRFFL
jgi:hypothetical protein